MRARHPHPLIATPDPTLEGGHEAVARKVVGRVAQPSAQEPVHLPGSMPLEELTKSLRPFARRSHPAANEYDAATALSRHRHDIVCVQTLDPSGLTYVQVADGCTNPSRLISGPTWVRKIAVNTGT